MMRNPSTSLYHCANPLMSRAAMVTWSSWRGATATLARFYGRSG